MPVNENNMQRITLGGGDSTSTRRRRWRRSERGRRTRSITKAFHGFVDAEQVFCALMLLAIKHIDTCSMVVGWRYTSRGGPRDTRAPDSLHTQTTNGCCSESFLQGNKLLVDYTPTSVRAGSTWPVIRFSLYELSANHYCTLGMCQRMAIMGVTGIL